MKRMVSLSILSVLIIAASLVIAQPPASTEKDVVSSKGHATVFLPASAIEVAPGVFSLGTAVDADSGKVVAGYVFVRYKEDPKKNNAKWVCGNGICEAGENANKCPADCGGGATTTTVPSSTSSCYVFLATDAKWKTVEPYVVNPSNADGLTSDFVTSNLAADIAKWEAAASTDILGAGSSTTDVLVADMVSTDGQNEVYFADISDSGAIGVTIVWGIFRGPPFARELVEWDQVYDDADFDWSASGEAGKMDFENIATHELGHSVGLGDLYDVLCSEMTMYGYASNGETKKRDLADGDINGVQQLY